ncbi:hypothetical protein LZ190_07125 [Rhodovulum sulfidophilum]|nr:hypothetical protein [Rhodovulum sulfidophilum]
MAAGHRNAELGFRLPIKTPHRHGFPREHLLAPRLVLTAFFEQVQNSFLESLKDRMRDELRNEAVLRNLAYADGVIAV